MNDNLKFAIEELDYLMKRVARVHGHEHPELIEISDEYDEFKANLLNNKDLALKMLNSFKTKTNDFTLPADACQAYERVFKAFKIIENELE